MILPSSLSSATRRQGLQMRGTRMEQGDCQVFEIVFQFA